ncbi:modifier of mdg4 isoform X2 [Eurytemora carolleeae]|uniref:modifier of mdg4 isoform X2 n=1 Tax=Eurytemora carolleeae TaxID=1294199 RepID=UPI000C77644D|nr:modifier of mdg4 isoform X2 [Eurytemora carolleeae]|eukprot:XP_023336388.1 modifier of mdg4-like isoform X2 [Eurytemora affinis]
MSDQQFCLKWNNYAVSVTSVFRELLAEEQMCDVTLSTQDKKIKAHRIVLTACSAFFKNILKDVNAWQHPVVFLKDMKYSDLRGIIEFIYHGEVSIDQSSLSSFLQAAESLKIRGLTEDCRKGPETKKVDPPKEVPPRLKSDMVPGEKVEVYSREEEEEEEEEVEDGVGEGVEEEDNLNYEMDEEEEEAMTEQEVKNSSLENIYDGNCLEKFENDEMYLGSPGLLLDPSLGIPGSNPALLGAKKTCPYCFQQLSWHALSRHIRLSLESESRLPILQGSGFHCINHNFVYKKVYCSFWDKCKQTHMAELCF